MTEMNGAYFDVAQICVWIEESFEEFCQTAAQAERASGRFQISTSLLVASMTTCTVDLDRHRLHTEKEISSVRYASYVSYWISKLKPVQINDDNGDPSSIDVFVNEMFAIFVLLKLLKVDNSALAEAYYFELVYHLRFRSVSAEVMYLIAAGIVGVHRLPEAK
jgi:hypothetical protein